MQKIVYIGVEDLHPHPDNPRKDLGDLTELAASIKAKGVLQNLTVVPGHWMTRDEWAEVSARYKEHPTEEDRLLMNRKWLDTGYTIIIGHRRHGGAKLAGLTELPCVIVDMTPQEQFETMMVENVHRSDLTVYEQAEGFQTMLDMGGSVEQVAQKTGFSESTIRNRVKLLRLDKKKFHEAQERGGTMNDYLRLNSIEDTKLRNKVLSTVGTAEFENTLKSAKEDEEAKKAVEKLLADLEAADWCEKVDPETARHGNWRYVRVINKYNPDTSKPEDADTEKYAFRVDDKGRQIYLYREESVKSKNDPMEEKKKILTDELSMISAELDDISDRHAEMRMDYIANFNAFNSSEMDIATAATKAMLYCADNNFSIDPERLGNLLGIPVQDEEIDPAAWNRELFNRPQRVLLCTAYIALEGSGRKYNYCTYDAVVGASVPVPKKKGSTLALDLIYECLKSLDYEMSEEEQQMKNGTHPLYRRAQALVNDFLQEKEAAHV